MEMLIKILIEGTIVFILIFLLNYFLFVRGNKKLNIKDMPLELIYLKKICNIDVKKINFNRFQYVYCLINTFIITTTYLLVIYLIKSMILRVILGIFIVVLLIKICYTLLGRYYQQKYQNK